MSGFYFKELLSGGTVALFFKLLGLLFGYLFVLLIARGYGAEIMGLFILSYTLLNIFSIIGKLGLDSALLRFTAEYSSHEKWDLVEGIYSKISRLLIPHNLLLAVLLFILSPYLATYIFAKPELTNNFRVIAFALVPFVFISIHAEKLRGIKRFLEASLLQNPFPLIFFFAVTLLALQEFRGRGELVPVIIFTASIIVVCLLSFLLLNSSKRTISNFNDDIISWKTIFSVSLPMLLSNSLYFLMGWTDTIMLGIYKTKSDVGVYAIVVKLATLTTITLSAVNTLASTKFAELYSKGNMRGFKEVVYESARLNFWTSFPVILFLAFFPSFALGFFGAEFKAGLYALMILLIGQFVNALSGSCGQILLMTGRQNLIQNIILAATLVNIILNLLLIPRYGMNGAAFASMVAMVFWNLAFVFSINKNFGILSVYLPVRRGENGR